MKVLYSCLSRSWGGMEMYTITSIKQLQSRGVEVEFLCYKDSRLFYEAYNMGIIIHPIKASGYFHPFQTLKLSRIFKHGGFDLVHTQASRDLWVITPALKLQRKNIPLFFTKQLGSYIVKKDFLHRKLYDRVDCALAISSVIINNLLETTPLTRDKIELHHNGIDINRFSPENSDSTKLRTELGIKPDEILLGNIARLSFGKGHEEILKAAAGLNKKYDNLKFLIVGEASRGEDAYAGKIKKTAEKLGLTNMIFTGFRNDVPDVLAAMDIFVFPSHSEAFGIALAEAMAVGVPSVCARADGILDVAVDGETSLFFEPKNAEDLEEKLDRVIASEEMRNEFAANARERAVKKFDIEKQTDKILELYKRYLNRDK